MPRSGAAGVALRPADHPFLSTRTALKIDHRRPGGRRSHSIGHDRLGPRGGGTDFVADRLGGSLTGWVDPLGLEVFFQIRQI